MKRERTSLEDYFWARVEVGRKDECWAWIGTVDRYGYGKIHLHRKTPIQKAHRVSWGVHNGPIPEGMCVLHHCDNPGCVNPAHLFLGTHGDNARDREMKHRGNHGKLNRQQALEVYKLSTQAILTQREIGQRYGIDGNTVSDIKLGITWGWVTRQNNNMSVIANA